MIVIANDEITKISQRQKGDNNILWIKENELKSSTGFELKDYWVCYDNICIPLSENEKERIIAEDNSEKWVNICELSKKLWQAIIFDEEYWVWSLWTFPQARKMTLESNIAPDFEIKDRAGKIVRLSDFKGKKVLIVTFASWCGCRFDVKAWQEIYEELDDENFEIICVAEDSQWEKAAWKWFDIANATFHCIVDDKHKISSLFGFVNVPTGAWIDEYGKIVRVNEAAYAKQHDVNNAIFSTTFGSNAFWDATKKWVKHWLTDDIKQSNDELQANIRSKSSQDLLADVNFKMWLYFQEQNNTKKAGEYFEKANKLAPDNWNYHRQSRTFKSTLHAMRNWLKNTTNKSAQDETRSYYRKMDLPNAPTRRVTKFEFFWTKITKRCKKLLKIN